MDKTAATLLEDDPACTQRLLPWELPLPLPCVPPRWGREPPSPRAQAWSALVTKLEGPRSGTVRKLARSWPVVGERTWPHAWVERVSGSMAPPSEAALVCADTIDVSSSRPKVNVGPLRTLFRDEAVVHVRSLWMYCCPTKGKWLGDLAKSPALGGLKYLNVHGTSVDAMLAAQLLGSTTLASLERLDLGFNSIRAGLPELFKALASGLPKLEALCLRTNGLKNPDFEALAERADVPAKLRSLHIGGSDLQASGLAALVERWPVIEQLEHLDISTARVGDAGIEALAGSGRLAKLGSLNCSGALTGLGGRGVGALLASPNLPSLRSLDLGHVRVGDQALKLWQGSEVAGRLTRLSIPSSGLSDSPLRALLPNFAALEELNLAHNSVHGELVEALIEACPRLRRLNVSSNVLDEDEARALLRSESVAQLDSLELSFFGDRATNPARTEFAELAAERGVFLVLK